MYLGTQEGILLISVIVRTSSLAASVDLILQVGVPRDDFTTIMILFCSTTTTLDKRHHTLSCVSALQSTYVILSSNRKGFVSLTYLM